MARRLTERERRREVEGWRASGESQKAYARARGYSPVSLARWAAGTVPATTPTFVRLEVAPQPMHRELIVEVGGARVRVGRGFDRDLLREVVSALSTERAP